VSEKRFMLDAESLCSKWGFGDGDALDDWWWDTYDEDPDVNTDELLYALVMAHLVPAIRDAGHSVDLERIDTIHNPVRAVRVDEAEVDWYSLEDTFAPTITVWVTRDQVEDVVRKTTGSERSISPPLIDRGS